MALAVGTNSWATRTEIDAYLNDKPKSTDWFALDDTPSAPGEEAKDSYIVSAFYWLSAKTTIPNNATSDSVKNAQAEAALYLYRYSTDIEKREAAINSGVKSFDYQEVSETLDYRQIGIPEYILGMIAEYSSGNSFVLLRG